MNAAFATTRRNLLLLPSLLTVAACQPTALEVNFEGTAQAIKISAFGRWGFFDLFQAPASMANVVVWRHESDPQERVWEIRSRDHCQSGTHRIMYGVPPRGFEQTLAPHPLSEGIVYAVWIDDCSGLHSGGAYFEINNGRVGQVEFLTLAR